VVAGLLAAPDPLLVRKTLRSLQYVENNEDAPELTLYFGPEYDGVCLTVKLEGSIRAKAASFVGETGQEFAISIRKKGRLE
jgi:hypothetical protein